MAFFLTIAFTISALTPKLGDVKYKLSDAALPSSMLSTNKSGYSVTREKSKQSYTTPYYYSFENDTISKDGWFIVDDANLMASAKVKDASFGSYVLASDYNSSAARAAWAFSPAVTLTAGTTYYVSTYVYAPGYNSVNDEFKITVGSAQTSASQTIVLIDKSGSNAAAYSAWTKVSGTFTPTTDGDYYFGINVCTASSDVNLVEFDGFAVNAETLYKYEPQAEVYIYNGGLWSASADTTVYLSPSESINYLTKTIEVNSLLWSFNDATPDISEDAEVSVVYNKEGSKTASLEVAGDGGSKTVTMGTDVIRPATGISDLVWNFLPSDFIVTYSFSSYNYLVGMNSNYKRVAEKYVIPSDVTVSLNSVGFYVSAYNITSSALLSKKVTIKICSVGTDGLPGTTLATYSPTFTSLFGSTKISTATLKTYTLSTPFSITGSFFIDVSFTADTSTPSATNMLGIYTSADRSDILTYNSCYAYYNSEWNAMTDLVSSNLSSAILPNLSFVSPSNTAVDENMDSKLTVYYSNNILNILNATPGLFISVYDMTGKTVYGNIVSQVNGRYPISAEKGIYFVKVGDKVNKFVIE